MIRALRPYKQGSRTACDYCPYHAVCGFDTKTAGYGFRQLCSMSDAVWEAIEREEEEMAVNWTDEQKQVINSGTAVF